MIGPVLFAYWSFPSSLSDGRDTLSLMIQIGKENIEEAQLAFTSLGWIYMHYRLCKMFTLQIVDICIFNV